MHSRDRDVLCYWGSGVARFPIRTLEETGCLVAPFDKHSTGADVGTPAPFSQEIWTAWMNRLLDEAYASVSRWKPPFGKGGRGRILSTRSTSNDTYYTPITTNEMALGQWTTDANHRSSMNALEPWEGAEDGAATLTHVWQRIREEPVDSSRLPDPVDYLDAWDAIADYARARMSRSEVIIFYVLPYLTPEAYVRPPGSIVLTLGLPPLRKDAFVALGVSAVKALLSS